MTEINLLPVEDKSTETQKGIVKKLSVVAGVVLVATAALALVTLVMFTNLASERQKLNTKIDSNTSEIASFKSIEELITVTKDKASVADKILSARTDQVNVFNQFSQIVPVNVYFTDIKFTGGKANLSGKAKSSADIAGFISSLASDQGAKIMSNVNIDTLGSDQGGVYSFSISAEFVNSANIKSTQKGSKQGI